MSVKILRLDDWQTKEILKHEALKGKKLIARGAFSMVFESDNPKKVLKLTADSFNYWMMNCIYYSVSHRHFPKVGKDFGVVGEIAIKGKKFPVYLFEVERLEKLENATLAKRTARLISNMSTCLTMKNIKYSDMDRAMFTIQDMMRSVLPPSVKNALAQLEEFTGNYPGSRLDMHIGNFMKRKNGELVIVDPIMDIKVYKARHAQVYGENNSW